MMMTSLGSLSRREVALEEVAVDSNAAGIVGVVDAQEVYTKCPTVV